MCQARLPRDVDSRIRDRAAYPILRTMTDDDDVLADVLSIYTDDPMSDGDVALLLPDEKVCVEVEGLASHWDTVLRANTAHVLRETTRQRVLVCIARRHGELRPSDHQLWQDLHVDLRDSEVQLLPLRALPAA